MHWNENYKPARIYLPSPMLGWQGRPDAGYDLLLNGKIVQAHFSGSGFRLVPNQPASCRKSLWVLGCSFAFGHGLTDDETFCALLQRDLPDWKICNFAQNGYSTTHALIQAASYLARAKPACLTYCFIPAHRQRNVAHVQVIQGYQYPRWVESPIQYHPKAEINRDDQLIISRVRFKRPDLSGIDLTDYYISEICLDMVAIRLMEELNDLCQKAGVHFFVTVLRKVSSKRNDVMLIDKLRGIGMPLLDIALPSTPEYTFMPTDEHPNALANEYFASGIKQRLVELGLE